MYSRCWLHQNPCANLQARGTVVCAQSQITQKTLHQSPHDYRLFVPVRTQLPCPAKDTIILKIDILSMPLYYVRFKQRKIYR